MNKYLKEKKSKLFTTDFVLFFIYTIFVLILSTRIKMLFMLFTFCVFLLNKYTCSTLCSDVKFYCLIIYLFFIFAHAFPVSGTYHTFAVLCSAISVFSGIIIFDHFKHPTKIRQLKIIYEYSMLFIVLLCVYALILYSVFPGVARPTNARAFNQHYGVEGGLLFNPGYGFACAVAILAVFLLGLISNGYFDYNKKTKIKVIVSVILMVLTVYETQSTITFIILLVGIVCCYYFKKKNKIFFYFKIAMLPIIVIAVLFFIPKLGQWLIDLSYDKMIESRMYKRLFSLGNFFVYGNDNADAMYAISRFTIPLESISTFLKNPLFGVAYKHGCGYYRPYLYGVGNHCEFFDALANYGIFGGTVFLAIYFKQAKEILTSCFFYKNYSWIVTLILLGSFNPLLYFYVSFVFMFLMPTFCLVNDKRLKKEI